MQTSIKTNKNNEKLINLATILKIIKCKQMQWKVLQNIRMKTLHMKSIHYSSSEKQQETTEGRMSFITLNSWYK